MPLTRVRALVFDNLSWKLLSVCLALLIWSGARLFMRQEVRPLGQGLQTFETRDFTDLPIRLLTPASNLRGWTIHPSNVVVRVSAEATLLDRLTDLDPLVFVDAPPATLQSPTTRRVDVRVPPAVRLVSVIPERVEMRPIPPESPH